MNSQDIDPVREALAELVAFQDYEDTGLGMSLENYVRNRPLAWEAARRALSNVETAPQADAPASEPAPSAPGGEALEEFAQSVRSWAEAYPLDIFPKPDLKKAAQVLKAAGMTLDSISADAMRHVITKIRDDLDAALQPKRGPQADGRGAVETPSDARGLLDIDPLSLAIMFHHHYERLAPSKGYGTRVETRIFDPESPNGKLMVATCESVLRALASPNGVRPAAMTTEGAPQRDEQGEDSFSILHRPLAKE